MHLIYAHSGDPRIMNGLLYPSEYSGLTYTTIAERFLLVYGIPALVLFIAAVLIALCFRKRPIFSWSEILIVIAPISLWLTLIYEDSTHKGASNILELAVLGALVGLVLGINGRLIKPWINGITSAWILSVVGLLLWLYVPGYPLRYPSP